MVILWTKAIIVLQLKHQVINSFFVSRTLNLMPRFKWETSVFVCELHQRVRIAVGIFCSSWHMGHPPKAMKYITCGVMPFRPWHAFCGPLVRLSCHHRGISFSFLPSFHSLYVSIASSPHLFHQIATAPLFWFRSTLPALFITPIPSVCSCLYPPSQHGCLQRPACQGVPRHTAVPWSRNPTLTLGFRPEII